MLGALGLGLRPIETNAMKNRRFLLPLALLVPTSLALGGEGDAPTIHDVTGRYLEARTASVFAGACHYGSEYTTNGREAALVWSFDDGEVNGTGLAGRTVAAVVTADVNLAVAEARHASTVYVPRDASEAERAALVAWLVAEHGAFLGTHHGSYRNRDLEVGARAPVTLLAAPVGAVFSLAVGVVAKRKE